MTTPDSVPGILQALNSLIRGESTLDSFVACVDEAALHDPDARAAVARELEIRRTGREITEDMYLRLKAHVVQAGAAGATARSASMDGPPTRPRWPTYDNETRARDADDRAVGSNARAASDPPEARTWITEPLLEPGTVIGGRYVLVERLGEGGMGVVFKAKDRLWEEAKDRDPFVAIKFLSGEFRHRPEAFMVFQREMRRAAKLSHPNIIRVHTIDRDGALVYITMELLEGEPLDRFIDSNRHGVRFKEAWPIIDACGKALAHLHSEGLVHSDFKPANVFITDTNKVKVLDFGIARVIAGHVDGRGRGTQGAGGTVTVDALTPAYASPEMLLHEPPDPRDDIYAIACVSYELLAGRHPFNGESAIKAAFADMPVKRTNNMKRRQHHALERGLAFKQSNRTPSADVFLAEMSGFLGRSRRRLLLSVTATALLGIAIAAGVGLKMHTNPDQQMLEEIMRDAQQRVEQRKREQGGTAQVDEAARDALLKRGRQYMELGLINFDPGLLSEDVASAFGAFIGALDADPSSIEAGEGIVRIVKAYEAEIRQSIEKGDYQRAATLADIALAIRPGHEPLLALKRQAAAALNQARD